MTCSLFAMKIFTSKIFFGFAQKVRILLQELVQIRQVDIVCVVRNTICVSWAIVHIRAVRQCLFDMFFVEELAVGFLNKLVALDNGSHFVYDAIDAAHVRKVEPHPPKRAAICHEVRATLEASLSFFFWL